MANRAARWYKEITKEDVESPTTKKIVTTEAFNNYPWKYWAG